MTHLNQTDGLEDPFTGPRTASTRSSRTAAVRARGQQTMSALSQTLSSRLNSAKAQSAPAQDHKASSDFPPCPRSPVAINPVERSGSSMVPSLNVTLGARPTAPIRSFSASQPPSSRTNVSDTHGALRGSASSLSTSSSPVNSNTAQMGPQRSISGPSEVSSQPSLRSNVRKSSIAINQPAPDGVTQPAAPVARPRPSTNVIAQCPSSSPTSQRGPGSETPTRMLAQGQSSSPVPTVAAVHEMPPLPAGRVPYLKGFTVFPNLPTELQQEIWSIAIAVQYHKEKRFLRVAPDPKTLDRTDDDAEVAQLRIIADIHRRPRLVPSLLHVCQYTRNEAIKGYELWGCADPITYEKNHAMVYVKVDIDTFFFGDADLGDFWVFHTFLKESEPENVTADDTGRGNFIDQIGWIKHFTIDYELWAQMLEYEQLWLANLHSANQITVAIRNPNHEQFSKDYALSHVTTIVPHTFQDEAAQITLHMSLSAVAASRHELRNLNWPESGHLDLNVRTLSAGNATGNTPEDESYLEDVLIEGNRRGLVSDQYLEARLAMIHANQAPQPPPAPVPTQNN